MCIYIICICMCMYMCMCMCMYTCKYICVYIYMYMCISRKPAARLGEVLFANKSELRGSGGRAGEM